MSLFVQHAIDRLHELDELAERQAIELMKEEQAEIQKEIEAEQFAACNHRDSEQMGRFARQSQEPRKQGVNANLTETRQYTVTSRSVTAGETAPIL